MNNFLRGRVGNGFVNDYVQTFSLFRLADNPQQTAKTGAEAIAVKFGPGIGARALGARIINTSTSLGGIYYGSQLQGFGAAWLKALGAFATGAMVGATYADILAYLWCSLPDPDGVPP
jgi:hypothetical protein